MRKLVHCLLGITSLPLLAACSAAHPLTQPVAERNGRAAAFNETDAAADLHTCQSEVRRAAPVNIQPRWLPPLGPAANGVVLGTVDTAHPVWPSHEAYRQAIEECTKAHAVGPQKQPPSSP